MALMGFRMTEITIADYESLQVAWRLYGDMPLVSAYVMTGKISRSQIAKLPKKLQRMLICGRSASAYVAKQKDVAELERLFRLEDPRG
jgi:hypothetical protein